MPNKHTKTLWKWFSRYIRLRDSKDGYCTCPTCGHIAEPKDFDAGHVYAKGSPKYRSIEFDRRNVYAQCKGCNNWRMRQPEVIDRFKRHAVTVNGQGKIDNMLILANLGKKKLTDFEIDVLEKQYRKKVLRLLEEKHIGKWW